MMPDKNEASDVAANESVEDAKDTVDPTQQSAEPTHSGSSDEQPSASEQKRNPEDASKADAATDQSDLAEAIEAEASLNGSDPLGFGEQRMGDDEQAVDEVTQLRQQLEQAEAKAAEHWDRLLRLQADMENQRKRAQNDVSKARKFALEGIVGDLLPVRDSLEMGLSAAKADDAELKSIVEGADLTLKMLAQVFEKNNIAEINPVDEKFNPEFHQAMSMQEVEGKAPNTVTAVMQKGYTLNDRLVRPALVMVAK